MGYYSETALSPQSHSQNPIPYNDPEFTVYQQPANTTKLPALSKKLFAFSLKYQQ